MKKVNLKAYLIAVFCLIVFDSFTQAQTERTEPNVAPKADSNEIELARQKKHLQFQKQAMIKKWRKLKANMSEKQVRRILGKPKLIQSGSHECVWFYQDLPVSNAKPNFRFRERQKERQVTDRYGTVVEKIGLSDVGGVKNGIVFFEAKGIDALINDERAKRDEAIAEAKKNFNPSGKRCKAAVKRLEERYDIQVKRIRESSRSLVFALRFFNQPDWDRFEGLSANKKSRAIKQEAQIDRWEMLPRWKKLKINMPIKQVHALLGEPEGSETTVQGTRENYGDVSGHGELYFLARSDLEEYLESWVEPFWPKVEKSLLTDTENESDTKPKVNY